jgi:hypothetical protein
MKLYVKDFISTYEKSANFHSDTVSFQIMALDLPEIVLHHPT